VFERFTDRARRVVVLAQEEARTMAHNYIGTEHILLGLIHEGDGIAALTLVNLGVRYESVRAFVEREIGRGTTTGSGHIPFTPRAKKILELSLREALQLRHNYIGTEHILLGLIREGEGLAAQAITNEGVELLDLRHRVLDRVGRTPRERASELFFAGGSMIGERLTLIQESLDRIERHLGIQRPEPEAPPEKRDEPEQGHDEDTATG
jgi:ATP-dependent Clp protease ATP-binding subunit ClpA